MTRTILSCGLIRCLVVLALLLNAACEHMPRKTPDDSASHREHWEAKGKLALKFDGQSKAASFNWVNRAEDYDIALFGFMGLGNASIKKQANKVTLSTKEGSFSATSAENLMQQELGWSIPVSDLRYWIRGTPSPYSPASEYREHPNGLGKTFQQNGWQLSYEFHSAETSPLPYKIQAAHQHMRLTFIVKSWSN